MDVHRCRFVPYTPQAINALAFSRASDPKQKAPDDLRLAIGRANGDIEIWNPLRGNWCQEKIFRGSSDRIIEQLAWTHELIVEEEAKPNSQSSLGRLRLFSSGGSSSITEWDLETGTPARHASGNFGEIWCFSAQPQWNTSPQMKGSLSQIAANPCQLLAAGCSDGRVILFTTSENGLEYSRIVAQPPAKRSRVISLAWRDRNSLVIGYERSTVRIIDIRNRRVIREISLGKPADRSHSVVWALKSLPDGTILSGDSSGELKIWDAHNFSLVQRLKTHDADILDITASNDGKVIYSCGVDRKTVSYAPVSPKHGTKSRRWQETMHRRFHQHDVKAITAYESEDLSIAISGGMDTAPVVIPLRKLDSEYHRKLSHLPQKPQISVSAEKRLLLTWWAKDLFIWSIPRGFANDGDMNIHGSGNDNRKLLARLQLGGDENLTSAEISRSGNMVVAATVTGVKLFQIRLRYVKDMREVRTRQVDLPPSTGNYGASYVGFSPNEKWLFAVRPSNVIALIKIMKPDSTEEKPRFHPHIVKLDRAKPRLSSKSTNTFSPYKRTINSVTFSSDSRILASGDLSGAIHTWLLEGAEAIEEVKLDNSGHSKISSNASSDPDTDSESESESDDDDETISRVIHGQKWIKNPNHPLLTNLDSPILHLTFKPSSEKVETAHLDGNIGLHATRHTPHPVSHRLPLGSSAHLVAITFDHQVFEFDVLKNTLTDWSRRNPPSMLPVDFKTIKDRILGSWWDCRAASGLERLWMYGTNWVFMVDLTKDFESIATQKPRKTQRIGNHDISEPVNKKGPVAHTGDVMDVVGRKRKRNEGAGDEMVNSERSSATVKLAKETGLMSPTSENDDIEEMDSLAFLRRDENSGDGVLHSHEPSRMRPSSWHTFRYRSIFGACVMERSTEDGIDTEEEGYQPEVVLIERPLYDVELQPRSS